MSPWRAHLCHHGGLICVTMVGSFAFGSPGIGQGRVTENLKGAPIDEALLVLDTEVVDMVSQLVLGNHLCTS